MATQTKGLEGKVKVDSIDDLSGGVQTKTTTFLNRANELQESLNVITSKLGGISKRPGYAQKGSDLTSTTTTSTSTSTTSTSTSTTTTTSTSSSTTTTA